MLIYWRCLLRHSSRVSMPKIPPSAGSVLRLHQSHAYESTRRFGLSVATPSSNAANMDELKPRGRWSKFRSARLSAKDRSRIGTSITKPIAVPMPNQDMTYICHVFQRHISQGTVSTYKLGIEDLLHPPLFIEVGLIKLQQNSAESGLRVPDDLLYPHLEWPFQPRLQGKGVED